MKNKYATVFIMPLLIITFTATVFFNGCQSANHDRNIVYQDMKTDFETSDKLSANIGLFSKSEHDGEIAYTNGGSGVIFDKRDGAYYALTAAHVVSTENSKILVFTTNIDMKKGNYSVPMKFV